MNIKGRDLKANKKDQQPSLVATEGATGDTGTAVVEIVSSSKTKKLKKFLKLRYVIPFTILIIAVGCLWAIYINYRIVIPKNENDFQYSQTLVNEGNYSKAERLWQSELSQAKGKSAKLAIYFQQSAIAVQFKKYSAALTYANDARSIEPKSYVPYTALAQIAQAEGNKSLAKKYWQDAINNVNKNTPGYNLIIQQYEFEIGSLK